MNKEPSTLLILADLMESHHPQPLPLGLLYEAFHDKFFVGVFPLQWACHGQSPRSSRLARALPLPPAAPVAGLVMTWMTFQPPLPFSSCKGGVPCMGTPNWGHFLHPHPWHHFCLSHSGMEKQPIRDCGGLFLRKHVFFLE